MLFEPFEEELDLPTLLVQSRDGQGREREVVGQEAKALACLGVDESNPSQRIGVVEVGVEAGQQHGLVELHASFLVHWPRSAPLEGEILLGPCDEKGLTLVESMESREIQISAIDDVKGASFKGHQIQDLHFVCICRANVYKSGDVSPQVQ